MEENKPKETAYVICSKTLKELHDIAKDLDMWSTETVYEYNIDRSDMSEEQKKLQADNRWYREQSQEFRIRNEQLYSLIKKLATEKILSGCKKDIKKEVYEEVYNTELKVIGWIVERTEYDSLNIDICFGGKDEWGNDYNKEFEYSTNMEEFSKKLSNVKNRTSFSMKDDEYVLLEKINVTVRPRRFSDIDVTIRKQIDKFIKEELTYCLKKDEVVVPQEYLDKGEEGIKEWRDLKSSKNKNNSIEKKILRQAVNDKKKYAYESMCRIMATIELSQNASWKTPFIAVDGRWNKQRTTKLVNNILDNKTQQFYIDITDEEIMNKFKEHWKNVLMTAYKSIDKLTTHEEENAR